ncbi:hypothetical protein BV25DRAFT_1917087 [Artomyces pyxidatus]|uniref:Uncharacterized protein n=1 Tax=Artomyces pyxidatus TaxID=48021 RepID=A0ACB8SXA0_9AGAM|nr:hypothetical protein BV25DRAFT_1917087 [Artomyces pyxidatus]
MDATLNSPTLSDTFPEDSALYDAEAQYSTRRPLMVKLTLYRLLNIGVMAAFGVPKAIASYRGESAVPTTLDRVSGVSCAILLYWLGLYEAVEPRVLAWLFHEDYSLVIVRFFQRSALLIGSVISVLKSRRRSVHVMRVDDVFRAAEGLAGSARYRTRVAGDNDESWSNMTMPG